jgi:HAMP domain-containing protein
MPDDGVAAMSDELTILWLFAVPIAALLWVFARTQYRVAHGRESGQLRKPTNAATAAGVAALAAAFGFLY